MERSCLEEFWQVAPRFSLDGNYAAWSWLLLVQGGKGEAFNMEQIQSVLSRSIVKSLVNFLKTFFCQSGNAGLFRMFEMRPADLRNWLHASL